MISLNAPACGPGESRVALLFLCNENAPIWIMAIASVSSGNGNSFRDAFIQSPRVGVLESVRPQPSISNASP